MTSSFLHSLLLLLLISTRESVPKDITETCHRSCQCSHASLTCTNQKLKWFPDFCETLPFITRINLSYNDIATVEYSAFCGAVNNVTHLDVSENELEEIGEGAFRGLQRLTHLDLSYNFLQDIPDEMVGTNHELILLNLSSNYFGEDPPRLVSNSLKTLDLSLCNLKVFREENTVGLPNLEELLLHANYLTHLDFNVLGRSSNVKFVSLENNVWHCGCSNVMLWDYLVKNGIATIERSVECYDHHFKMMYSHDGPTRMFSHCGTLG